MTQPKDRKFWTGVALIGALALYILWSVLPALSPVFISLGLAYAFSPVMGFLEKRGLSRTTAAVILMASASVVGILALLIVLPPLSAEIGDFIQGFPHFFSSAIERVAGFAAQYGVEIPVNQTDLLEWLRSNTGDVGVGSLSPVVVFGKRFLSGAGTVAASLFGLLIIPVFIFFFVRDLPAIYRHLMDLVPPRRQPKVRKILADMDGVIAGYIRGQMMVALILAVAFSVALLALGIKYGLVIGFFAGLLNLVPYLGQIVGFGLAMTMALVDFDGVWKLIAIPVLFVGMNFIEGNFITPKVVGGRVGLPPVWAIISIIVATQLLGFWGLVIGVPAAGCIRILLKEARDRYHRSDFYRRGKADE